MRHIFSVILLLVAFGAELRAQASSGNPPPAGTRKQIATIIYSGLGGAVLGLSTLSFYGRPQEKLENIAIGLALGIITGAVVTTYGATTNPDKFYGRDLQANHLSYERLLLSQREQALHWQQQKPNGDFHIDLWQADF